MPRITPRLLHSSYYKNFPKAYMDKQKGTNPKKVFGNRFGAPDLTIYDIHPDDYVPTEEMPWTMTAKFEQRRSQRNARFHPDFPRWNVDKPCLNNDPEEKWTMFVGDRVQVLVGRDKGKQGIICDMVRERDWCYVYGLNCKYDDISPPGYDRQVVPKSQKLDMKEEVALIDPTDEQPTTVALRWTNTGERVRVSTRTGRVIPIPTLAGETFEYETPATYRESEVDTPAKVVEKATFVPDLHTFEEDIMRFYGIKEERERAKSYWY